MNLDEIKKAVSALFKADRDIHIDVAFTSPRASLKNERAKITGVYPHLFKIEEYSSGRAKTHTFQYSDVFIGQISIRELS